MENKDNFYVASRKERILINEVISRLYTCHYKKYLTDPYGNDVYDGLVIKFEDDTYTPKGTDIYEAKIRDRNYPTVLLERKKFKALFNYAKRYSDYPVNVFYLSCHPEKTYLFHLDKKRKYNWVKEEHNKSTMDMSKGTEIKEVVYLDIEEAAYVIDIRSLDIEKIDFEREKPKKIDNIIINQKRSRCLYDYLTKKDDDNENI